jgi:hypothetical protein
MQIHAAAFPGRERGDYFNFIHVVKDELRSVFSSVCVVRVGMQAAWYVYVP